MDRLRLAYSCQPEQPQRGPRRRFGFRSAAEIVAHHLPCLLADRRPLIEEVTGSIRLVQLRRAIANGRVDRPAQDALQVAGGMRYSLRQPVENQLRARSGDSRLEELV